MTSEDLAYLSRSIFFRQQLISKLGVNGVAILNFPQAKRLISSQLSFLALVLWVTNSFEVCKHFLTSPTFCKKLSSLTSQKKAFEKNFYMAHFPYVVKTK